MKWGIVIFVWIAWGCQHEPEPWTEEGRGTPVFVRAGNGINQLPPVTGYQVFVYDEKTRETGFYECNLVGTSGDRFNLELPSGTYTGFCMVNVEDKAVREYSKTKTPGQIFIRLKQAEEGYCETKDYLLGQTDFTIQEDKQEEVVFDLERKVARLRVIIENVPPEMNDLMLHVTSIPEKMNLLGEYTENVQTVVKRAERAQEGVSTTSLFLFPARGNCGLSFSYKMGATSYTTSVHELSALLANRITEIRVVLGRPGEGDFADFQVNIKGWDEKVISDKDWYIDIPAACKGKGNGVNLVRNGSFEEGKWEGLPLGWNLGTGGADRQAIRVGSPVLEGKKAVCLEGKTYLYQDIPVRGDACYQFQLYANSPSEEVKWRWWCTWMSGTTNLPSEDIRTSEYHYQTQGYMDVFRNQIFRSPATANKLRLEVRTYTPTLMSGIGLYVDAVRVELVE